MTDTYITTTRGASFRSVGDVQPLPLYPGEQVWRLIRGNDEDEEPPSRDDLISEAVAILRWSLGHGRSSGGPWELISTGDAQWTLGDARPLRIEAVSHNVADATLPDGKAYARRETYPGEGLPIVVGSAPWYVLVRFWWRGPGGKAAAWPVLGFGTSEPEISRLGWMLDAAVSPRLKTPDPGDKGWAKAKVDEALEPGKQAALDILDALTGALKVVVIVGGIYVGWRLYQKGER